MYVYEIINPVFFFLSRVRYQRHHLHRLIMCLHAEEIAHHVTASENRDHYYDIDVNVALLLTADRSARERQSALRFGHRISHNAFWLGRIIQM